MPLESRNQKGVDDTGMITKTTKDGKKIKVKTIRLISGTRIKEGILSKATI
jgi:tRNA-binding EMAP/Myf-like protein